MRVRGGNRLSVCRYVSLPACAQAEGQLAINGNADFSASCRNCPGKRRRSGRRRRWGSRSGPGRRRLGRPGCSRLRPGCNRSWCRRRSSCRTLRSSPRKAMPASTRPGRDRPCRCRSRRSCPRCCNCCRSRRGHRHRSNHRCRDSRTQHSHQQRLPASPAANQSPPPGQQPPSRAESSGATAAAPHAGSTDRTMLNPSRPPVPTDSVHQPPAANFDRCAVRRHFRRLTQPICLRSLDILSSRVRSR